MTLPGGRPICSHMAKPKTTDDAELIKEWPLSTAATLG